jgi:hypothetical protein
MQSRSQGWLEDRYSLCEIGFDLPRLAATIRLGYLYDLPKILPRVSLNEHTKLWRVPHRHVYLLSTLGRARLSSNQDREFELSGNTDLPVPDPPSEGISILGWSTTQGPKLNQPRVISHRPNSLSHIALRKPQRRAARPHLPAPHK